MMDALKQADNIVIQSRDLMKEIALWKQAIDNDPLVQELRELRLRIESLTEQLEHERAENDRLRRVIA